MEKLELPRIQAEAASNIGTLEADHFDPHPDDRQAMEKPKRERLLSDALVDAKVLAMYEALSNGAGRLSRPTEANGMPGSLQEWRNSHSKSYARIRKHNKGFFDQRDQLVNARDNSDSDADIDDEPRKKKTNKQKEKEVEREVQRDMDLARQPARNEKKLGKSRSSKLAKGDTSEKEADQGTSKMGGDDRTKDAAAGSTIPNTQGSCRCSTDVDDAQNAGGVWQLPNGISTTSDTRLIGPASCGFVPIDVRQWADPEHQLASSDVDIFVHLLNGLSESLNSDLFFINMSPGMVHRLLQLNWTAMPRATDEEKVLVSSAVTHK